MADDNPESTSEDGVSPAEFPDLGGADAVESQGSSLDMVRDIPVALTVQLGKTEMLIEEVMRLTPGQVIELDKLAGEPLDILVNGKPLARGEVVVVDDNFGIRITAIVDPRSRVAAMGEQVEDEAG